MSLARSITVGAQCRSAALVKRANCYAQRSFLPSQTCAAQNNNNVRYWSASAGFAKALYVRGEREDGG